MSLPTSKESKAARRASAANSIKRRQETLSSFLDYCFHHPNERFWQSLRNWSGAQAILRVDGLKAKSDAGVYYRMDLSELVNEAHGLAVQAEGRVEDTFYKE